jgi:hypothetical protein
MWHGLWSQLVQSATHVHSCRLTSMKAAGNHWLADSPCMLSDINLKVPRGSVPSTPTVMVSWPISGSAGAAKDAHRYNSYKMVCSSQLEMAPASMCVSLKSACHVPYSHGISSGAYPT